MKLNAQNTSKYLNIPEGVARTPLAKGSLSKTFSHHTSDRDSPDWWLQYNRHFDCFSQSVYLLVTVSPMKAAESWQTSQGKQR